MYHLAIPGLAPVFIQRRLVLVLAIALVFSIMTHISIIIYPILYFLFLFIHELGHYIVARFYSYTVLRIEINLFSGQTHYIPFPRKNSEAYVAMGGPIFQIILWVLLLFVNVKMLQPDSFDVIAHDKIMTQFLIYSLFWIVFNLLPIEGLDGSKAWSIIPWKFPSIPDSNRVFLISYAEEEATLTHGVISGGFVSDVQDVLSESGVKSATVEGIQTEDFIRLKISPHVPDIYQQRIRNIWGLRQYRSPVLN